MIREIIIWGDDYYALYHQLDLKVKKKLDYVLWLIKYTEKVPVKFLKHLEDTDGLYEITVCTTFKVIRIFKRFI